MDAWRIVFVPVEPDDPIQGVRLRETIKKLAVKNDPKIMGQVRNINENEVELICTADEEVLKLFLQKLIGVAIEKNKVWIQVKDRVKVNDLNQWMKFNSFEIIYDEPVKETNLAIKGAERLFRKLSEEVQSFLSLRESQKLRGVENEILKIKGSLINESGKKIIHQHPLHAINVFLAQPFNEALLTICNEIDQLYYDHKLEGQGPFNQGEIEKLTSYVDRALVVISQINERKGNYTNIKIEREG